MALKQSNTNDVLIYGAGDVIVRTMPEPGSKSQFEQILPTLREADIRYCQLEQLISDRPAPTRIIRPHFCAGTKFVSELKYAGFDVVTPNGNHAYDFGMNALLDTIDTLRANGIQTTGVGRDIAEARRPATFERKGNKIAFLAYCSVMHPGFGSEMWVARDGFPGVAPMRAYTFYEQHEIEQPGTPSLIHTYPHRGDLEALKEDVAQAKASHDIVIVTLHFGIHRVRAMLADYQRDVTHAAIDAGADVIIGTHPHIQKAVEVYKGKAIFYSLANFSFDRSVPKDMKDELSSKYKKREDFWALYKDSKKKPGTDLESSIVKIVVSDRKIKRVSFFPLMVNDKDEPYRPEPGSPGFEQSLNYTVDVTREAGIGTQFKVEGGEVLVVTD
jgi:poly-gamma-glutamate synthesis protein (capsule biosynthesis protein)